MQPAAADGWRQVGSHADMRAAQGDAARSSRQARHAVAAILLAVAGAAAVAATLSGTAGGQELAQLAPPKGAQGLAITIPGIRQETQDVINSGAWDQKAVEDDMDDGLLPSREKLQKRVVDDDTAKKEPLVVDHPYEPPPPGAPAFSPPLANEQEREADGVEPVPAPSPEGPAPAAGAQAPPSASGAVAPPPVEGEAAESPGDSAAPGAEGDANATASARPKSPWDFEDDVEFKVQGHCTMAPTTQCTTDEECSASGGGCVYWHCTSDPDLRCASNADCSSGGGICTGPGHCSGDPSLPCFEDNQCTSSGGSCVLSGYCSGVPSRSCLADADCGDSGGSCRTKNKVWWNADENFPKSPKFGPPDTWSRLQLHKKLLVLMLKILHMQDDLETQVPINSQFMGQITWLKEFLSSSSLEAGDSATANHAEATLDLNSVREKIANDAEKLKDDIAGMNSLLQDWDTKQDKHLSDLETNGVFHDKITGMSEGSFQRSSALLNEVKDADTTWNTTERPDGQTPELKSLVDTSVAETRDNVKGGIFRYKNFASSRFQTGYDHLMQLYKNFKYITESHIRGAKRDMGRINATTGERAVTVGDIIRFIEHDGHLETGTIANATAEVTALVEAALTQAGGAASHAADSLEAAKKFKEASKLFKQAKAARDDAGEDKKAILAAAQLYRKAAVLYNAAKAAKAKANAEKAAALLEEEAKKGGFIGEVWSVLHVEDLGGTGCTPSAPCARCQGDCDSDADCLPGLKCFQKDSNMQSVLGCTGEGKFAEAHDYCYVPYDVVPNMETLGEPTSTMEADSLDFNSEAFADMGLHDFFVVRWSGDLEVKVGGTYTFYDTSDDGSKVYINNKLAIDNDGLHGPEEKTGTLDLAKGRYPVVVDFFERDGGADYKLEYSGPDTGEEGELSGVEHEGEDCWGGCHAIQGPCNWCGTGVCCRLGWEDTSNGCDGSIGVEGMGHVCNSQPMHPRVLVRAAPKPAPLSKSDEQLKTLAADVSKIAKFLAKVDPENAPVGLEHKGEDCWVGCHYQQGPCAWCGTGTCCRKGWADTANGCDGSLGMEGLGHVCVPQPAVGENPFTGPKGETGPQGEKGDTVSVLAPRAGCFLCLSSAY